LIRRNNKNDHILGIIIIAVCSLCAFIAAKCCGVEIYLIGKIKKYGNDLRDRWKWLDKNLNRFKIKVQIYYNRNR
jgi:hypothetical protein